MGPDGPEEQHLGFADKAILSCPSLLTPLPNSQRQPSPAKNKPKGRDLDTPGRSCKEGRVRAVETPPPLLQSLPVLILFPFQYWAHRKQVSTLCPPCCGGVLSLCLMRRIRINHMRRCLDRVSHILESVSHRTSSGSPPCYLTSLPLGSVRTKFYHLQQACSCTTSWTRGLRSQGISLQPPGQRPPDHHPFPILHRRREKNNCVLCSLCLPPSGTAHGFLAQ